ncbi:flagellar basal-body rod modification protein FlgD [Oxalobacteraceae bacterium GrIS 2.11]
MSTTTDTVSPALLATMNPQPAATSATDTSAALQNRFMTLLLTQLKNQDPLNPMDNSQVTSQMAQLSTVSGIGQMNTTLNGLMSSLQASQSMQATNLIGKSVVVPGNALTLTAGAGQFGVKMDTAATDVKAVITNAAGAVVDTMDIGALPSGVSAVNWNGKTSAGTTAPDGNYTYTLTAKNGTADATATALTVGLVQSVSTGGTAGTQLDIPNLGAVNYSSVLQIL